MSLPNLLTSLGARRDPGDAMAWFLRTGWFDRFRFGMSWEKRQEEALNALLHATPLPWFVAADELDEQGWEVVDKHTRRLPQDLCAGTFLSTPPISYGNWLLYSAREPQALEGMPDPFRAPITDLCEFLAGRGIDILVASWPDDVEWRIISTTGEIRN